MSGVFVQLRVGVERYALAVEHVVEVTPFSAPTKLPGACAELMGLLALRGRVLPVYDLGACLEVPGGQSPTCVVVVADGDRRAGLAVDEVTEVGPLAEASETDDSRLSGVALDGGHLVGVVDAQRLLSELER